MPHHILPSLDPNYNFLSSPNLKSPTYVDEMLHYVTAWLHAACVGYPNQTYPLPLPLPPLPPASHWPLPKVGTSPLHPLLLPCIQEWNQHGVARICHMLTVLQPALASLEGASSSDAARQFDKARLYFSLLIYSPEGLQRAIMDKPGRFAMSEYTALLQVRLCICCSSNKAELASSSLCYFLKCLTNCRHQYL